MSLLLLMLCVQHSKQHHFSVGAYEREVFIFVVCFYFLLLQEHVQLESDSQNQ